MDDAIHKEKMNMARAIIKLALKEDLEPNGDISSAYLPEKMAKAKIISKEPGIMACSWLIELILEEYNKLYPSSSYETSLNIKDGSKFQAGDILLEIEAPAQMILATERTILNFLQRLCGIATYTNKLVELIKDYPVELLDTRKTMPGMRTLEKQAFVCGGGTNHRFNLSDMVMLKENHLATIGNLIDHINQIRSGLRAQSSEAKIEIEINKENLKLLPIAVKAGVDQIMLDNFSPGEIRTILSELSALSPERLQTKFEASGGINQSNIVDYAKTGVDFISTSISFTKANNIDLSMMISE